MHPVMTTVSGRPVGSGGAAGSGAADLSSYALMFVGDAGSLTCAHSDIAPDLELCHGLAGAKLIGGASHDATPRLAAEHVARDDDDDDERVSTAVPTHRPLRAHEAALLGDDDVSVACVLPGDLCGFASAALHFASNGADGVSAALFHGIVTDASLPRLVEAARRAGVPTAKTMPAMTVRAGMPSARGCCSTVRFGRGVLHPLGLS